MTVAFLGVTFLLAAFFPVGSLLALYSGVLSPATVKGISPVLVQGFVLLLTYAPAMVVTGCFFRMSKMRERIPHPVPGRVFMTVGVSLTLFYLAARLLASGAEGGGGSFAVLQLSPYILWPARVLLIIGLLRLLLSATPPKTLSHPGYSVIPASPR